MVLFFRFWIRCRIGYCWLDIYTLLDGLAYNTRGYFASCVVFFRAPQGREKMRAMSKMPRVLYAKPSNKRFIIPLQKGVILLQFYSERVF